MIARDFQLRMRTGAAVNLCLISLIGSLLAGCGSVQTNRVSAGRRIDGCVKLTAGTRTVELRPSGGPPLHGVLIGSGRTTFVLSNQSDEDLCSWLPFVRTLQAHGYSALLYDYTEPTQLPADARAAASAALAAGARGVVLMGASTGARASIEAAATRPRATIAVVSLAAEPTVSSDPTDLLTHARKVTIPTLLVSARADPFVNGATAPLLTALASPHKQALIVPGANHGTALLAGSVGARVRGTILHFVAAHYVATRL
jgi:pimeloyl-ACP methyl ester carboxylesterase